MGAADTASDTDGGPDDGADADVEVSSGVGEPVSTSAGDSGLDTPVSRSAPVADSRSARPEPFEHTFGAQAHPAEPTAGDPSLIQGAPPETAPRETPSAVVPPAEGPSTTPEQ
jgi:hypothetical protein